METLQLPAASESLEAFRAFVGRQAAQAGVPASLMPKVDLVLEEILTNHAHYAYRERPGESELTCYVPVVGLFCVQFVDRGPPFDPLQQPSPDLLGDVSSRPIGGLGLHLVRRMAKRIKYQRQDGQNILTVCFATVPENRAAPQHASTA